MKIAYTRPFVYPYQAAIIDSAARFTVTEAATKVGKTASHIIWLFEQALTRRAGDYVWWVAPVYGQAEIAFKRLRNQIANKDGSDNRDFFKVNETKLTITLPTGCAIQFKSAEKPDNLYGEDVYAAVFDEFTRAREESWTALRTTLTSTGGPCKFIGNVKGKKNWGYVMARKAQSGTPGYEHFKITAYDAANAGMLTKDGRPFLDEIEEARRDLPENAFKELYLAEATEDGTNPFGYSFIQQCTYPMSSNPAICYGIDLAKKKDYVAIVGLDKDRSVCYFERFTKSGWKFTTQRILSLPRNAPIAIDSTGVGDPIAEDISSKMDDVESFVFTPKSKQQIMEGLALSIQKRLIQFPGYDTGAQQMPSDDPGHIKYELENYEFEFTRTGIIYSAPEGLHDDCVCALALANHKFGSGGSYVTNFW